MGREMPEERAFRTVKNYRCSLCWWSLDKDQVRFGVYNVHCTNPNCEGSGFVTSRYVEKRQTESYFELCEVRDTYGVLLGIVKPMTTAQAMAKLGF